MHCWEGTPEYCWYPWLKAELEKDEYEVTVPAMPETEEPKQALWVPYLSELVGEPDEELILVGHSVGCVTILRYLEGLSESARVGGVVFVAGFTDDLGFDELKNYFEDDIDWKKIRSHGTKFVAIHSDNDPFVPMGHADVFKEQLDAEIVVKEGKGHFSGPVDEEESCVELPSVRDAVRRCVNRDEKKA